VIGLAHAFLVAGAQVVLATLWKVPDRPTQQLMATFYAALGQDADVAQALRIAQIDALNDPARADPYCWAAARLTGHGRLMFAPAPAPGAGR
jgi:CHAT domain-containing protein